MALKSLALSLLNRLHNPLFFFLTIFLVSFLLTGFRAFSPYLSPWDENSHLSYVQYAFNWAIPADGYPMNSWAEMAYSCHPHAVGGAMTTVPCGTLGTGKDYPTGGTNTSQIWPPVYFFIVANLMRVTNLFISDPLFSARIINAVLWTLGSTWIGLQVFRLTKKIDLGVTVSLLLVALPPFAFFTSSVGPHGLNTLIFALMLWIATRYTSQCAEVASNHRKILNWKVLRWLALFLGSSFLVALTLPQALALVGLFGTYMTLSVWAQGNFQLRGKFQISGITAFSTVSSLVIFYLTSNMWSKIQQSRAIPVTVDVAPNLAIQDAADVAYKSPLFQITERWWSFWPNGIIPEWPAGAATNFIAVPWFLLLTTLSIGTLLMFNRKSWLTWLMFSLFITAPFFSVLYDVYLKTVVPMRYGLGLTVAGVLSVGNTALPARTQRVILGLAAITFVIAFFIQPYYLNVRDCYMTPDYTIMCP